MNQPDLPLPLLSERLELRKLTANDHAAVWAYASDPAVTRYTAFAMHRRAQDSSAFLRTIAAAYNAGQIGALAIVERPTQQMIGTIGVSLEDSGECTELGWALRRASWGHGYASESLRMLIDALFIAERFQQVCAHAALANPASLRVMQKAGMRQVSGDLPPRLLHGELEPVAGFMLTRSQWLTTVL